jgi:hypothetical protein
MKKDINVGVIGGIESEDFFNLSCENKLEKLHIRKILSADGKDIMKNTFPEAEFVKDECAILGDSAIELVIVAAHQLGSLKQAIQAGKAVRVMDI